jgi:hypothetical protein
MTRTWCAYCPSARQIADCVVSHVQSPGFKSAYKYALYLECYEQNRNPIVNFTRRACSADHHSPSLREYIHPPKCLAAHERHGGSLAHAFFVMLPRGPSRKVKVLDASLLLVVSELTGAA